MPTLWILFAISSSFGDDIKIAEYHSRLACHQGIVYHRKTNLYPRHDLICLRGQSD